MQDFLLKHEPWGVLTYVGLVVLYGSLTWGFLYLQGVI